MKIKFILCIALVVSLFSCDEVEQPFESGTIVQPRENSRRVLILDFTGHNCAGCPAAARSANLTATDYPENIFVLSIHPDVNGLTNPLSDVEGEPFSTEWRTPEGNLMQDWFNIVGLPFGTVSGIEDNGNNTYLFANWRPVAEASIFEERTIDIELEIEYNETSRQMEIAAEVDFLADAEGTYNLILAVVENNIEDWQKNGNGPGQPADPNFIGGDIADYIHKHVLRGHLNGVSGEQITSGSTSNGASFSNGNTSTLDESFVAEEVSIYAYIYNTETLEIIDVVEKHIIE